MKEYTKTLSIIQRYKQIINFKKALGIPKNVETNKAGMLKLAKKHNIKEVFLLEYIIKQFKNMPFEMQAAYKKIIDNESSENFTAYYMETAELFKRHNIFKSFYKKIAKELTLKLANSRYFFNMLIYEITYNEIEEQSVLNCENPLLNMYLLQKWFNKHQAIGEIKLSRNEKNVIQYLREGYLPDEIISLNLINTSDKYVTQNILENTLPSKFKVESLIQALALYFYKYC